MQKGLRFRGFGRRICRFRPFRPRGITPSASAIAPRTKLGDS